MPASHLLAEHLLIDPTAIRLKKIIRHSISLTLMVRATMESRPGQGTSAPVESGQAEMYGRDNLDVLRARVLYAG